ncbi:MAG: 1-deoxy-D-xylulose-5-phosphate reductoisomerase [Deltaproteobacteria bacterium]|nr:1-deoxy-D-xylulose-5-phosphate reductoisomerase [Deltaproteobacteria bacterium]
MKKIALLGSTGSIGVSTLAVIGAQRSEFTVTALAAGQNVALLKDQIDRFRPRLAAVFAEEHACALRRLLPADCGTAIVFGPEGYREAATAAGTDMVVSAMVGAAGLIPTLEALDAGIAVALANKETLVMAGGIVLAKAAERGAPLIPVDSEHSAIFQCLQGNRKEEVRRIILTASGGPFLHATREELAAVTIAQALRHPNWTMGKKITIDSATMMNKGLEVIEAAWLFGLPAAAIDVVIHPQSIVHSLVEYRDGSVIAQLGQPDMRGPIAYALSYPRRLTRTDAALDLCKIGTLTFLEPDRDRFPALSLAYAAAKGGGTLPAVLNGANECAVAAFIDGKIGFNDISRVSQKVMESHASECEPTLAAILNADQWARTEAERVIGTDFVPMPRD